MKFFEGGEVSPSEEAKEITDDNESSSNSETESRNNSVEYDDEVEDSSQTQTLDTFQLIGSDYLYEAAICFSRAVQEEANLRYKTAFELYKVGIDNLLTGAKNDTNENRKRIAKTKAEKYLERAESLYENQISQSQDNETFIIEQVNQEPCENSTALEMPLMKLSDYKLVSINNCLMRVKDTNNKFYILKTFRKDSHSTISFPKNIPYMVKLINYFKTEDSVFLLLPMISGGLLWDYVNSYSKRRCENHNLNLEEMFVEPPQQETDSEVKFEDFSKETSLNDDMKITEEVDEDVVDAMKTFADEQVVSIPSFETLSSEMDISDLLSCSMNLLQSVSKTLEKSRVEKNVDSETNNSDNNDVANDEVDDIKLDQNEVEIKETPIDEIIIEQKLPESVLKQWTCELIVAVNSLHSSNIICGDLNLDNLLLGPEGHLTLTYFFQKTQDEFQQLCRLNPNAMKCLYVAFDFPITKSSDWYSVGVIIYELWTQERFFRNHPIGTFRFNEIQYTNPDELSENLKDLLHGLIIEKSENRLTYQDLICHPFFTDIDWSNIEQCGLDLRNKF